MRRPHLPSLSSGRTNTESARRLRGLAWHDHQQHHAGSFRSRRHGGSHARHGLWPAANGIARRQSRGHPANRGRESERRLATNLCGRVRISGRDDANGGRCRARGGCASARDGRSWLECRRSGRQLRARRRSLAGMPVGTIRLCSPARTSKHAARSHLLTLHELQGEPAAQARASKEIPRSSTLVFRRKTDAIQPTHSTPKFRKLSPFCHGVWRPVSSKAAARSEARFSWFFLNRK